MALETFGNNISTLNAANPTGADAKSTADDHIRGVKSVLLAQFPQLNAPLTASDEELNFVDGVTSAIQTQLDAKAPLASPALTGTPTAPTPTAGDSSTKIATMAAVQTAVAAVNAQTGALTDVLVSTSTYTVTNGQRVILIGALQQTITAPAYSDDGRWGFKVANNRTDAVINWNSANHQGISDSTMTLDIVTAASEVVGTNSTYGWGLV
jgi:hypothetical protein